MNSQTSVPTTDSTANSKANSPLSPDERQAAFIYAQTKLLDLVDEFMFEETVSGPIEIINDLLYHWLTTPAIDDTLPNMAIQVNRDQLDKAFQLVNFLTKAYELQRDIIHYQRQNTEVSNG